MNRMVEKFVKGEFVIHCPTQAESCKVSTFLHIHGLVWRSGDTLTSIDYWGCYRKNFCYSYRSGKGITRGDLEDFGDDVKIMTCHDFFHDDIY